MGITDFPQMPAEAMAAALGVPLFRADLHLPEYPLGEIGPWRVSHCPLHVGRGQWGTTYELEEVRRMQTNVAAKTIYFWGQELLIREQAADLVPGKELDDALLRRVVRERFVLPLLIPEAVDYPHLVRSALHKAVELKAATGPVAPEGAR